MAGFAWQVGGIVYRGDDLGKASGPGAIHLMATDTEKGGVQMRRLDRARIFRVFCKSAVAGFAVHACVLSLALHAEDIRMAILTGLVPGKDDRLCGDFRKGVSTIVAVFAETSGLEDRAQDDKCQNAEQEDEGDSQQVFGVLEAFHCWVPF